MPRLFCGRLLMHKHIWDEGCANSLTAPMSESKYHVVRSSEGHCTLQESELGQVPPQVRARAPSANPMLWVASPAANQIVDFGVALLCLAECLIKD